MNEPKEFQHQPLPSLPAPPHPSQPLVSTEIGFQKSFFKERYFIALLACFVLGTIVLICMGSRRITITGSNDDFIHVTAWFGILASALSVVLHACGIISYYLPNLIAYSFIEGVLHSIMSFFYFVAGCLCISNARILARAYYIRRAWYFAQVRDCYGAAVFFCWSACAVHGVIAFFRIRNWWFQRNAQKIHQQVPASPPPNPSLYMAAGF